MLPYAPSFTSTPLLNIIQLDDYLLLVDRIILAACSLVSYCSSLDCYIQLLAVIIIILLAYLCSQLIHVVFNVSSSKRNELARTSSALKALSKVLIPTTSLWPACYLDFIDRCHGLGRRISIPAGTLVEEVLAGRLELRHAAEDLPLLLGKGVFVDGWEVVLEVGWKEKYEVMKRALNAWVASAFGQFRDDSWCLVQMHDAISTIDRDLVLSVCGQYLPLMEVPQRGLDDPSQTFLRHIFIFSIPTYSNKQQLEYFIISAHERFRRDNRQLAVLLLTTGTAKNEGMAPSRDVALATMPFMRASTGAAHSFSFSFPTFASILPLLTPSSTPHSTPPSHPIHEPPPRILSMHNVSSKHAALLTTRVESLEYDDKTRSVCLRRAGVRGWREERLCGAWEAAAMRAGKMERWIVVLEKVPM